MESYLKLIRDFDPITKAEEHALFRKAKKGDKDAYADVITCNLKFVITVAKKYQNQGLPLEDLIAEGNLGLVKAYYKFDIAKDVKFITYAVWWIRQSIINSIHEHGRLIRLPLNKITNVAKINKAKEKLSQVLERDPREDEVTDYIGDPLISKDARYGYTVISLDAPQTENDKDLTSVLPSDPIDNLEILEETFREELQELLKTDFSEKEKDIIHMYYGINHIRPYTLKEIGIDYGLTRERIRQIKEKVLKKLRHKQRAEKLRIFL